MNRSQLVSQIKEKGSILVVGLDLDPTKLINFLPDCENVVQKAAKIIIEKTSDLCIGYKINTAFYEAMGSKGWDLMEEILSFIPSSCLKIADAKRGDIGNTAQQYAKTFFQTLDCDAVTVNPYMGIDTLEHFLKYKDKWTIVLGITSNPGASDFELLELASGKPLYLDVIEKVSKVANPDQCMFVVGATQSEHFNAIRMAIPDHFLLIPGIGSQGGNLEMVWSGLKNQEIGMLINLSRTVIYPKHITGNYGQDVRIACIDMNEELKIRIEDTI